MFVAILLVALVAHSSSASDVTVVWAVYDRGFRENVRLLAIAPGRAAYLFDETRDRTLPYDPSAPALP